MHIPSLAELAEAGTLTGLILGPLEYYRRLLEARIHVLKYTIGQLHATGYWAHRDTPGYSGDASPEDVLYFIDPRLSVFRAEASQLERFAEMVNTTYVPGEFFIHISLYTQLLSNLNQCVETRLFFIHSHPAICTAIANAVDKKKAQPHGSQTLPLILDEVKSSHGEQGYYVASQIYQAGHRIHYQIIGDLLIDGLKRNYHLIDRGLRAQVSEIGNNCGWHLFFLVPSLLLVTLWLYTFGVLSEFPWILNGLLVILISYIGYRTYLRMLLK